MFFTWIVKFIESLISILFQIVGRNTIARSKLFEAQTDREYKQASAQNDAERTKVELEQLHDGNPYNDTIKQI